MNRKPLIAGLAAACLSSLAMAVPIHGQGTWETTLQPRDMGHDGVIDAFYDTVQHITWLRDANMNGLKGWGAANAWAQGLQAGGFTDWRLPTMDVIETSGCMGYVGTACGTNEMAYLFTVEFGNPSTFNANGVFNTGDFVNIPGVYEGIKSYRYWTDQNNPHSNPSESEDARAWFFNTNGNGTGQAPQYTLLSAFAVRAGDVAAVPEPDAMWMTLCGMAVLALGSRFRRRQP
jgi:hypothetical protein